MVTVSESGRARAVAAGSAKLIAELDGRTDTVFAIVRQVPSTLNIEPDTLRFDQIDQEQQFDAQINDRSGRRILGITPSWRSANTEVVVVTSPAGNVRAVGAGQTYVTASLGVLRDSALVLVRQP